MAHHRVTPLHTLKDELTAMRAFGDTALAGEIEEEFDLRDLNKLYAPSDGQPRWVEESTSPMRVHVVQVVHDRIFDEVMEAWRIDGTLYVREDKLG